MKRSALLGAASILALVASTSIGAAQSGQKEQPGAAAGGGGAAAERSHGGGAASQGSGAQHSSGAAERSQGANGAASGSSGRAAERSESGSRSGSQGASSGNEGIGAARSSERANERSGKSGSQAQTERNRSDDNKSGASHERQRSGEADRSNRGKAAESTRDNDQRNRTGQARSEERNSDKSGTRNAQQNRTQDRDRNRASQGAGEGTQGRAATDDNNRNTARDNRAGSNTDTQQRSAQDRDRNDRDRNGNMQRGAEATQGRQQLSVEKRETVRNTIIRERPQRVTNVNVSIRVGERLPRRVQLRALPASIVRDVPYYRGYRYVMVQDEICIVNPATYEIVEVIDTGPGGAIHRGGGQQVAIQLSGEQRRFVYEEVSRVADPVRLDINLAIGAELPRSLELDRFPVRILDRVPELERYRYVFSDRRVVVVDPNDRDVVLLIGD